VNALLGLARRAAGGPSHFESADLDERLVRRHGLAPLAARLGVDRFRPELAEATLRHGTLEAVAAEAVAALAGAGVPVAVIKGISYARALYDHPGERPMTDVDLLVPAARFADAGSALAGAGLRALPAPRRAHAVTYGGWAAEIDLHRALLPLGWSRIDEAALWARARPAVERGDGALRLEPVDEALLHCLVLARGFWGSLIGYVDGARLLARLDGAGQAELLARARRARVLRVTAAALATIGRVTGTPLPAGTPVPRYPLPDPEAIATGAGPGTAGRVAHRLGLCDGPREVLGHLVYYAGRSADGILGRGGVE
jgi:hypothetical protein